MELYQKQQFDFLLMSAAERFIDRIVQRSAGAANALEKLKADRNADGIWLDDFVAALFGDFLLDNTAGAVFILSALERRNIEFAGAGKIEKILSQMARRAFAELLHAKTIEALEQSIGVGR
ncbi:MAG: hypothetical protein JSS81_08330 [Acidobacteria bacterium]|nr:hypothetical protein [Acidobacteriota bacterium]